MNLAEIMALEIKGTRTQCSPEWFAARVGMITGSGMYNCVPHLAKDGTIGRVRYDYRQKYIAQKVHEVLSGKCYEIETNARMEHGVKYEAEAREEYCKRFGNKVVETGAIRFPTIDRMCVSPDGIITEGDGIDPDDLPTLEIKCPGGDTHVKTMMRGLCPTGYYGQVQSQMMVANSTYAHFCTYDPLLPKKYRLLVCRVERDDEFIRVLVKNVHLTLKSIDEGVQKIHDNLGLTNCPF